MTETIEITAERRAVVGKSSKLLGREGKLPAVIYGVGVQSEPLTLDKHDFVQVLVHSGIGSTVFKLTIDDDKPVNVMVKDLKHDVIKGTIEHVDFWAINMKETVSTSVPINFIGSAEGEKTGGVMVHEMREVNIEALPMDLPEHIDVDVTALEVGQSLHVSDLTAPAGVTILDDLGAIVCAVMAPAKEEEEAVVEEATEPEVIGQDAEDGA
jgi:large subunit ribosomal protein L25